MNRNTPETYTVERIEQLKAEVARLRESRLALRNDNRGLRAELDAARAELTSLRAESAPPVDGWEAYSAGVQNGYDHRTAGEQPNWFAVATDYAAWLEQRDA